MGRRICVLRACPNRALTNTTGAAVVTHKFPHNEEAKTEWEYFVNIHNRTYDFKSYQGVTLCSAHFEPDCHTNARGHLKKGSLPTIPPEWSKELAVKFGLISGENFDDFPSVDAFIKTFNEKATGARDGNAEMSEQGNTLGETPRLPKNVPNSPSTANAVRDPANSPTTKDLPNTPSTPGAVRDPVNSPTTPAGSRKHYIGDLSEGDFETPRRRKRALLFVKDSMSDSRRTVKLLQQKLRRSQKKIDDLKSLLKHLVDSNRITPDISKLIEVVERS